MDIQMGTFKPDASALERIAETAGALRASGQPELQEMMQAADDEMVEVSSESSEEQIDLVQLLEENEPSAHRTPFPQCQDLECVAHKKSGIVMPARRVKNFLQTVYFVKLYCPQQSIHQRHGMLHTVWLTTCRRVRVKRKLLPRCCLLVISNY